MGRQDYETETLVTAIQSVNTPREKKQNGLGVRDDGAMYSLTARDQHAVCFTAKDHGADAMDDCSPTLRAGGHSGSHANAGVMPAVAFAHQGGGTQTRLGYDPEAGTVQTLSANQTPAIAGSAVRRLTPRECERLQGFPDDYTAVPYRGKPAADGPRYKALGNSMAVPVMRWIGERIQAVEALELRAAA
jgi:DNA (cytosine-5)-methyltransferase 1